MMAGSIKVNGNFTFSHYYRTKKTGKKDGIGIIFWSDGSKYEGQFRNDMICGNGRKLMINGEYYKGQFDHDLPNGYGTYIELHGAKYEGEWKDGKMHGRGTQVFKDGEKTYVGQYYEGKMHGQGTMYFKDGSYYEGDFVQGLFHG